MQRLNRSNTELNKSIQNEGEDGDSGDQTNRGPPIEKGLSFDKWLEVKLKKEKEVANLKKSAEAYRLMQLEK